MMDASAVVLAAGAIAALVLLAWPVAESFTKTPVRTMTESLRASAAAFVQHARTYHGSDPRVLRLLATWHGDLVATDDFPSRTVRGSFSKETGQLKIRVADPELSDAQLRGVLLHELAHTNGAQHNVEWRDCFVFFLNIATRELGWDVTLSQPINCREHAICSAGLCALCGFEGQRSHEVTRGKDVSDAWSGLRDSRVRAAALD